MDTASGWGKPLKKTKEPAKEPTKEPPKESVQSQQATTHNANNAHNAHAHKLTSKSEPYVQKPPPAPIQIVARAKEGLYLVNDHMKDYQTDTSRIICEEATLSVFSPDGDILAFANPYKIGIYIFSEQNGIIEDVPNIIAMSFSPAQKFLVTIDKRENKHFIIVFEPKTLKKIYEYETTRYKKETWPQLKFVGNDELAFRALSPGRIDVLDPAKNFELIKVIETKPFDFFGVSTKRENLIIVTVNLEHSAGYEKNEGRIDIYSYDNPGKNPVVSKVIDKAHEVNLFFSPTGDNLLAWAQTFTDKTGQSYYGEHVLLYLDMAKKTLRRVPTYKGPIHDVAWNPNGQDFIAISGFMPASSVLYTNQNVPKFEFGHHHRNTIRWNPFSRYVCLGGFGNLSGDMEIWDMSSLQKVGSCKSNTAVSCIWSPDGKRILTGVLNPRLRVDNCYRVFKYTGDQMNNVDFSNTELYEVIWRPGKYKDEPSSPKIKIEKKEEDAPKLFRPKGAGTFAAQLKAQKDTKTTGKFLDPTEIFGNEANVEVEEEPKKKKRIRKKKDNRKGDEEGKDDDEDEK